MTLNPRSKFIEFTDLAPSAVSPVHFLLNGSPTGTLRESCPRSDALGNSTSLATGVMTSVALPLFAGDVVTSLTFVSGATAGVSLTNWWFALYSAAATPALLSQSADQLTAAWNADQVKTLTLGAPQVITVTGIYYAAAMVKAATPPSLVTASVRATISGPVVSGMKVLARTSGSGLTDTAPATIASPTTVANMPYCVAT